MQCKRANAHLIRGGRIMHGKGQAMHAKCQSDWQGVMLTGSGSLMRPRLTSYAAANDHHIRCMVSRNRVLCEWNLFVTIPSDGSSSLACLGGMVASMVVAFWTTKLSTKRCLLICGPSGSGTHWLGEDAPCRCATHLRHLN